MSAPPKSKRKPKSKPKRPQGNKRSRVDTTRASAGPLWSLYLRALGPGLVTGASDDDPSGIATYAQAGAKFGFGLLWTSLLTLPLMAAVQEICDRTALATGKNLGRLVTDRFAGRARIVIGTLLGALFVANLFNITADLAAIGEGANLLHAGPSWLWALLAGALVTAAVITGSFETIARAFKILCLALFAYVGVLFTAHVHWTSVAVYTFVPHIQLSAAYFTLLVAVLGTTISPYLFFWQSAHRIEELRDEREGRERAVPLKARTQTKAKRKQLTSRFDVFSGMTFSNLVMFAIIVATASTLGHSGHGGHADIGSAAQAARALKPVAGASSSILFALGFIGAGFLAVPVLAGSGSAGMAGLLHKDWGFSRSPREAPVFYGLVSLGTIGGTLLTLVGVNPIKLLVIVAVINGIAAAPFLAVAMVIAGNRKIMGNRRNGRLAASIGWITVVLMAASSIVLVATMIHG